MWAIGQIGMKHLTNWEKIAVVTDNEWIRHTVDTMGWLLPAKVKTFSLADEADASEWVTG
jgi:hypothetical protein